MIELKGVSFKYGSSKKQKNSIKDISLHISKGECVIITGESGCGKTTLTRILNGLCPNYYEGLLEGTYILDGERIFSSETGKNVDVDEEYEKTLDEIGMIVGNVFQDPRSQFFTVNTTDEIVLAMENRDLSRETMRKRLREVDSLMDIDSLLNRNLFMLSSGEKQKVAIASAVSVEPKVIVFDEPSANLDTEGMIKLGKLLKKLKEKGYTIVLSEHRMNYLKCVADRMIVMKSGSIEKDYSREEILKLSDEEVINMGLRVLSDIPPFTPTGRKLGDTPLLRIENMSYRRGKRILFSDYSAEFYRGQVTAITGKSGIGKTTFCRIISGEIRQNKGKVFIYGANVPAKKRVNDCFFVGQDADYQIFTPTVLQEVTLNTEYYEDDEVVKRILDEFDLWEYRKRHPASLSGGQKQRVILAAALLMNKPILILDEPTSGLDGRHMRIIAKYLRAAAERGICVLVITHDREFINNVADNVLIVE
ncbi:MAG: ABC transporter ATP-binding protein [Eubacterium sp.]|nr:ABC transporter ATP-binding protein [Eubacterium sp.]